MKSGRRVAIPMIAAGLAAILALAAWLLFARPHTWPNNNNPNSFSRGSSATDKPVRFKWQFEGATKMTLRQTGESDYRIALSGPVNFVIFKVEGAAGQTLRFTFAGIPAKQWNSIRFLCGYGEDLSEPSLYERDNTGRSRWKFAAGETSVLSDTEVAFSHQFDKDSAYIALRVPYMPDYQQRWLAAGPIAKTDGVELITVGDSAEHRPLTLIRVGSPDRRQAKLNPCVLMYAREHGDEPDASWAVQGALRFLRGESADAKKIRQQFTYLFIPILDPDGVADGQHTHSGGAYHEPQSGGGSNHDASTYARWFRQLIDSGGRLDVVLNFHNPEPRGYPHVLCPRIEREPEKTELARALLAETVSQLNGQFQCNPKALSVAPSPGRLGDYLARCYGALHVPFEVNSQYPPRRLTHDQFADLGRLFVLSSARFLESRHGAELKAVTARTLSQRAAQMAQDATAAMATVASSTAPDDLLEELKCRREIDQQLAKRAAFKSVDDDAAIPGTLLYDTNSSPLPRPATQQLSQ